MPESESNDRRRPVTVRVFRSFAEHEAADREYWKQLTPTQRLDLTLELSEELYRLKGEVPDEPGICRSVTRLYRR